MSNLISRRKGEWKTVKNKATGDFIIRCSECGRGYDRIQKYEFKYCPHCGAKMEKED